VSLLEGLTGERHAAAPGLTGGVVYPPCRVGLVGSQKVKLGVHGFTMPRWYDSDPWS